MDVKIDRNWLLIQFLKRQRNFQVFGRIFKYFSAHKKTARIRLTLCSGVILITYLCLYMDAKIDRNQSEPFLKRQSIFGVFYDLLDLMKLLFIHQNLPSPNHLDVNDEADMLKNRLFASLATALASMVLPLPGGPNNNRPLDGARNPVNNSGRRAGSITCAGEENIVERYDRGEKKKWRHT
jgi:hypothetical protein